MWHRINQQIQLLANAPFVDAHNCTIATGMSITSFQITPIELNSLQSAGEIPIPAPVILPQKTPNTPFEVAEITDYISSNDSAKLANTGHLYHGIGDFDIGKICYGAKKVTTAFSRATEYQKIARLDYVDLRYPADNLFSVRFEPWYIKIVS